MSSSLTPFTRPAARDKRTETATATPPLGLVQRPRRNRKADWSRRLVAEHVLTVDDLIWPLFLIDGTGGREPVSSMPGVERLTVDEAVREAARAARLGIPAIAVFPNTDPALRDPRGSEALNGRNLVCQAVRAIKAAVPEIGVVTDVALDPYTSHGHDGLLEGERILNDETVAVLVEQSLIQAEAGADVIAPSDMMDGRVGAIRRGLDDAGFHDVQIMAYAAKYASAFYGPFRDAVGTNATLTGDKRTYQMDPGNTDEALREVALDLDEGADMVMVKPGLRGRRPQRLARRQPRHDGEPPRLQARRRRWRAHLLRAAGGREAEGAGLILWVRFSQAPHPEVRAPGSGLWPARGPAPASREGRTPPMQRPIFGACFEARSARTSP
jgi:porphobilinogen synthase